MHDKVILVVDYEKICRLCLQSTGAMSDIFENDTENSLRNLILHSTGLEVSFPFIYSISLAIAVTLHCKLKYILTLLNYRPLIA